MTAHRTFVCVSMLDNRRYVRYGTVQDFHAPSTRLDLNERSMTALTNQLLELLPIQSREQLIALSEPVELRFNDFLWKKGETARHVHFPLIGVISLLGSLEDSPAVEIGMVGHEGFLGMQLASGRPRAPLHAVVQSGGSALRIDAVVFRQELLCNESLRLVLDSYDAVCMTQLRTAVVCAHFHRIEARLARWLLMTQDRARSATFVITQQFLSDMLGVRRVGITTAASSLQARGFISYRRGVIEVLSRAGLIQASCRCYDMDRRAYGAGFADAMVCVPPEDMPAQQMLLWEGDTWWL
jgi:CRP-like cAMP-binding protein